MVCIDRGRQQRRILRRRDARSLGRENRVHYVLDVSMHEDASRVRKSPISLSILRSFALNILRLNKVNNIADALWRNAMNLNRVLAYGGT